MAPVDQTPRWRRAPVGAVLLFVVAYVPLLLTRPGEIGADTKTYLYLDPGRLLSRAAWMWDTNIGLGTVTHQNIGYLWPMGPYYWLMEQLGLPDWVAQRLWLGSIVFGAGMGVRFMLRELRWAGPGLTVASFAYALSPYLLHYGARISVILLPFAGLPWLIGIAARSLRRDGWRWPAAFALVTLTVGGVNATSLLLVMAGPLLWFVHATFVTHEVTLRRAVATGLRITALTAATSLWWIAGLAVQGTYGIPILRYTEAYFTVAAAALSTELMRGLGYWFFYGRDALGAWISPAVRMAQSIPALALSFALPLAALVSGFLTRFRNRGFFALLVAVGLVTGVGAHPWESSTPAGALFKAWTRTDSGLAFRSTPRAVPLIALGLAVLLAAGLAAVVRMRPQWRLALSGTLLVLICLNQWALFGGEMVDRNLRRPETLPEYWIDAARAMDAGDPTTRVYEMPGADFASYRWGNTVDPVTPGLIDRPFVARELIPYGTPPAADLVNALDVPLQEGSSQPASLVPVAQLMGVGTIAHRADLRYERFRTPRPRRLEHALATTDGLVPAGSFGEDVANVAVEPVPLDDELELGTNPDWPPAPAVSLWDLEEPRPVTRTVDASSPTLLSGDGAGIVAWAATGGLDPDRPILYSASYAGDPDGLDEQLARPGAQLVVTDTNRRSARRWGSVRENDGYTERADEEPLEPDPTDNRLDLFPDAGDDARTVSEQLGGAVVAASDYGNPVSYTPADRAAGAMDGDLETAWAVGAFAEPRGEYLEIRVPEAVDPGSVTLVQTQRPGNRWITEVELTLDDGAPITVALDEMSRTPEGQVVELDSPFHTLRITLTDLDVGRLDRYVGISDVGFAEVRIPGVDPVTEVVRPPTDLLDAAGPDAIDHPLSYVFTRRRSEPAEVVVRPEERRMMRWVEGPDARSFTTFGEARLSAALADRVTDELLGVPGRTDGGLDVSSSGHLAGDVRSRATAALDGDPATAWQTPINGSIGAWMEVVLPDATTVEALDLAVRRDGLHSVPTRLGISVDGADPVDVAVPEVGVGEVLDPADPAQFPVDPDEAVARVEVPLPRLTGTTFRVSIEEVAEASSRDWFTRDPTVLPVAIAELGLGPTVQVPGDDTPIDTGCLPDLITIDGEAVAASVRGTVGDALDGAALRLAGCDDVGLDAGRSLLETTPGEESGWDVDQLVLASAPGGIPGRNTLEEGPAPAPPPPDTSTRQPSRLGWDVEVRGAEDPYWVVLGQSLSPGFRAVAADGTDLGEPQLLNGYANGWLVDPAEVGADTTITITWPPQRLVFIALALSAVGVALCLALLVWAPRRRTPAAAAADLPPMAARAVAPLGAEGTAPGTWTVVATASAVAVAMLVFAGWGPAVVVTVVAVLALVWARGQALLRLVGIGAFALAAAYVVAKQARNGLVLDFEWPLAFETTHAWTLTAVGLLVVDAVVGRLRRRAAPEDPGSGGDDPEAPV